MTTPRGKSAFVPVATGIMLAAAIASAASISSVRAEGALAVGILNNDASKGFAAGWSRNQPTIEAAQELALKNCREEETAPQNVKDTCRVVRTFVNQCVIVVLDPGAGTPGAGWAVAETRELAIRDAKRECDRTAGPSRQGKCTSILGSCDGTAK